ncbi:MAG: SMEK domain-containing protein [Bacteroidetes bacterium]|nr:SMEK domain-containing protein [Bacteroidota bacterium]
MNRIDFINKITTYSARFVLEVEGFNAVNMYDINIHAESFLIPVLNETFGLNLENLNSTQKKNFPAIDLADFKNRVAFQVTATNNFSKIEETLQKFFNNQLNKHFDVLYFYIITQKKEKYKDSKLAKQIPSGFSFNAKDHIIDREILLQKINSISSSLKLEALSKIFQQEFSDIQIELRKKEYVGGYLNNEPENLSPNLLSIAFPDIFYKAELDIDKDEILADLNRFLLSKGKSPIKKMREAKLIKQALRKTDCKFSDWLLHENCIYTFRNLNDEAEPYRKIVDKGTITTLECKDFYERNEDNKSVFKHLLRNTLTQFCKIKEIEWYGKNEIFRFANNPIVPNQKQVKWKGKNESTKSVIFEMHNKKEGHIICFRHLAFRCSFLNISNDWFLVLNPTWSFTNPGGYHISRFEPAYLSGLKRLENNNAVFNYFRFFGYYFSHVDLFTVEYPYFKISPHTLIPLSPKLEEKTWKPVKILEEKIDAPQTELKDDKELNDISLFD